MWFYYLVKKNLHKDQPTIYLTKDFDEKQQGVVLKVIHSNPSAIVFWYLNENYIGSTQYIHEIEIRPKNGTYRLTAIDELGHEVYRNIQIKH